MESTTDMLEGAARIAEALHRAIDAASLLTDPAEILEAQGMFLEEKDILEELEQAPGVDPKILPIVESLIAECQVMLETLEEKLLARVSEQPFQ